jgi:eukaryotic-like serine/threonine-protein kinase
MIALSMLMDSRFQPSHECVALAKRAVSASDEADDLAEAGHVTFTCGLIQVFRGDFEAAANACAKALELSERTGELVLQARCLTYLAVAYRRMNDWANCKSAAERAFEISTRLAMVEYIAMATANLAWVAWRQNDHAKAEKMASEALNLWHGMEDPYSFDWMALWPLIAIAFARKDFSRAVEYARGLLDENQHPLAENLTAIVRSTCEEWERGAEEIAIASFVSAIQAARDLAYL